VRPLRLGRFRDGLRLGDSSLQRVCSLWWHAVQWVCCGLKDVRPKDDISAELSEVQTACVPSKPLCVVPLSCFGGVNVRNVGIGRAKDGPFERSSESPRPGTRDYGRYFPVRMYDGRTDGRTIHNVFEEGTGD
jgi:hypothetical protein